MGVGAREWQDRLRGRASGLLGTDQPGRNVVLVGVAMIVAQMGFRTWALLPGWFFLDDYNLLIDAKKQGLGLDYLVSPYNGHLMPSGRFLVWVVSEAGSLSWGAAATTTLLAQAAAGGAALWMLVVCFGATRGVLPPLAIYLTSAVSMPAFMWWAAALTLLPLQATFFAAVALWVTHLREPRPASLLGTVAAVAVGLTFDVKGLLVLPVLAFVAVAYFAAGSLRHRLATVVRQYPVAVVLAVVLGAAYSAYYVLAVPQITAPTSLVRTGKLGATMLGDAWPSGAFGGPWQWDNLAPPTAFSDPPTLLVHLCWVLGTLLVLYGVLRRTRTLRAWALLGAYLLALLVLLGKTRGAEYGSFIGMEYRYLTDSVSVLTLVLGLVFLRFRGAAQSSAERDHPLLTFRASFAAVTVMVTVVAASGLYSSASYARIWHTDNASDAYMHNLQADLDVLGRVDLADTAAPESVLSRLTAPLNTNRRLASLTSGDVAFPEASPRLGVVGPDGTLRQALIQPGVLSREGPTRACGWRVTGPRGTKIPLRGDAFPWTWWVRIGYLASAPSDVTVTAGDSTVRTRIEPGPNNLYLRVDGGFDTVEIDGLSPGTTLCVDTIEVGQPVPGGAL